MISCGGDADESTASFAITQFFNTLESGATIAAALSVANGIIDDYNSHPHPGGIEEMDTMHAVYGAGISGQNTFTDLIKP